MDKSRTTTATQGDAIRAISGFRSKALKAARQEKRFEEPSETAPVPDATPAVFKAVDRTLDYYRDHSGRQCLGYWTHVANGIYDVFERAIKQTNDGKVVLRLKEMRADLESLMICAHRPFDQEIYQRVRENWDTLGEKDVRKSFFGLFGGVRVRGGCSGRPITRRFRT